MVTGDITYSDWNQQGSQSKWDAFKIPAHDGYTTLIDGKTFTSDTVAANNSVSADTQNQTINITYTANDQTTHIIYQDANGNVVKTDTVTGKTDQTVDTKSSLPTGWKIAKSSTVQTIPSTITFKDASTPNTIIIVDHVMTPVDHTKPVAPGTKTVTGQIINGAHDADLNKTITRTINITDPHTGLSTQTQIVKLSRNAKYDEVTGEVTYDGWNTGNWAEVTVPTVDGYTPSQTSVAAETVTDQTDDSTINITYTANEQTVTIKFVDDNENGKQVGDLIPKQGVTGQTITDFSNVKVPEHYQLAKDNSLPTSYTFTANKDQTITIHLIHATKIVDGKDSATIPSDVDKNQLIHTVTRTITDNVPGQNLIITKQTATITRHAIYDEVTKQLSHFSDWTTAKLPSYAAKGAAGYTPSQARVAAEDVTPDTPSSNVEITYTANDQMARIIYEDGAGNVIKSDVVSGKTGQTVAVNSALPTGWRLVDRQSVPTTITFGPNGHADVVVLIEHVTIIVHPGETAPTGPVPGDPSKNYPPMDSLTIHPTRTIVITYPDGRQEMVVQKTEFTRTATFDEVTGQVTYSPWVGSAGQDTWPAYRPAVIDGYEPSQALVKAIVDPTADALINITYHKTAHDNVPDQPSTPSHTGGEQNNEQPANDHESEGTLSTQSQQLSAGHSSSTAAAKQLPQTGNAHSKLGLVGLALIGLTTLLGMGKKKRDGRD